jgi:hypothetical protein
MNPRTNPLQAACVRIVHARLNHAHEVRIEAEEAEAAEPVEFSETVRAETLIRHMLEIGDAEVARYEAEQAAREEAAAARFFAENPAQITATDAAEDTIEVVLTPREEELAQRQAEEEAAVEAMRNAL